MSQSVPLPKVAKISLGGSSPAKFISSRRAYLRLAAPACETTSSCAPEPPLTPMAPMTLPPTISGLPPRDAVTSSSVVK